MTRVNKNSLDIYLQFPLSEFFIEKKKKLCPSNQIMAHLLQRFPEVNF